MLAQVGMILVSLSLGGCFYMPVVSKGKVSTLDQAPRLAATVSSTEGKAIAAFDPNSKVATTIAAPTGALTGSSVTLPAGALAIAAELVVEEAVPLSQTSVTSSLAINSDITIKPVGSGLIIRPTENVDLTKPLTIAMPINPTAGLRAWLMNNLALNNKYYAVFYKYLLNGELKAGVIPSNELRFSETGSVLFEGYFGAYWLAEVSAPIQEKVQVTTDEPIVNKANVAVVTNTGIVTETEVVAKTAIPPVQWLSVTLELDAAQRSVSVVGSIGSGRTLNACQADLFEKTDASSGLNLDADSALKVFYKVVKLEAHTLFARFRCLDDQGRQTISPWSSALSIPGAIPTPVVTQPTTTTNFCASGVPELRLTTTVAAAAGGFATQTFTSLGNCVYTVDLDAIWGAGFGIATADGKTRCMSNQGSIVGDQTLSCAAATDTTPNMWMPPGNYTIRVDFSASATNPKMSISLQSCAIGDLYLLTTTDYYNWPAPGAANRMTHLGGCQYSAEASKLSEGNMFIRMQNLSGSYSCGDGSSNSVNYQKSISCGASSGYYSMYTYGPYIAGYKFIVNLGNNLDMYGQPTSTSYLWTQQIEKCQENRYILGPTSAGNNRQPGVNSLQNMGACNFQYSFIQSGATFSPFFIGVGEGSDRCGLPSGAANGTTASLDCSASAVAIDLQSYVSANVAYRLIVQSDPNTGRPSSIDFAPLNTICMDPLYAVKNSTTGFRPSLQSSLTEVNECIYQYEWIPTAASRSLSFVQGNNPGYRCAKFPGSVDPVVGGPAVDGVCYHNYNLNVDYPYTPVGVVDGQRYTINLDMRLGQDRPRINIASQGMKTCPELYVIGLGGVGYPDNSNKMLATGDCNYSYRFRTTTVSPYYNYRIMDAGGTIQCGRDSSKGSQDPSTGGQSVSMACGPSAPSDFYAGLGTEANYQINVHYESSGSSTISMANIWQPCNSMLDGAAGSAQNAAYSRYTAMVGNCVEEVLWVPTSTSSSFVMRTDYYGYASYCGLQSGSVQPTPAGVEANAVCSIFNVTAAQNFDLVGGVTPGSRYLVRLNRGATPYDPPKISVSPVASVYAPTQSGWLNGSTSTSAPNTLSFPSGRRGAATWAPEGSQYRYMYGGLGFPDNGSQTNLGDLWRLDMNTRTWALFPDGTYGTSYPYAATVGSFHAANRPGGRDSAVAIFDPSGSGKLWLFGGSGSNSTGSAQGYLNDLWVYDLGQNKWALVSGDPSQVNLGGAMGSFGVPAVGNVPGGRVASHGWIHAGKIYIFGGYGYPDSSSPHAGNLGHLNDLWVYDPAANTWAMIHGSNILDHPGVAGTMPSARRWSMQWKDFSGKMWLFGGHGAGSNGVGYLNDLWSYDPTGNVWSRFGGPDFINAYMSMGMRYVSSNKIWPASRFAAVTWTSSDGKLYLFGGQGQTTNLGTSGYLNDVWNFDPVAGQWTWLSGFTQNPYGVESPIANTYGSYGPQGTLGTSYVPGSRSNSMAFPDWNDNVYIFGGQSGYGLHNDLWYLDF